MENNFTTNCANCRTEFEHSAKYCHKCGQKKFLGKITFKEVVNEFIHTSLHLDTKLFKTLKYLFIPGKLTKEYFLGKHKTYANPVQLFFVTGAICFFIFKILAHESEEKFDKLALKNNKKAFQNELIGDLDSINYMISKNANNAVKTALNSSRDSLHKLINNRSNTIKLDVIIDSLSESFQDNKIDTLKKLSENVAITKQKKKKDLVEFKGLDNEDTSVIDNDTANINFLRGPGIKILKIDLRELEINEIYKKYKINGFIEKMYIKQYQKYFKYGWGGLMSAFIGKVFFGIIFIILISALLLKLLYWRQKRYYIEHIVFLLHLHSLYFLMIALLYILNITFGLSFGWQMLLLFFYLVAMHKYYRQRKTKTILKFMAFTFCYFIITVFVLSFTLVISGFLF